MYHADAIGCRLYYIQFDTLSDLIMPVNYEVLRKWRYFCEMILEVFLGIFLGL